MASKKDTLFSITNRYDASLMIMRGVFWSFFLPRFPSTAGVLSHLVDTGIYLMDMVSLSGLFLSLSSRVALPESRWWRRRPRLRGFCGDDYVIETKGCSCRVSDWFGSTATEIKRHNKWHQERIPKWEANKNNENIIQQFFFLVLLRWDLFNCTRYCPFRVRGGAFLYEKRCT